MSQLQRHGPGFHDQGLVARRAELVRELQRFLPPDGILEQEEEVRPYECDGLSAYRQLPLLVLLPRTVEEVQGILRLCHDRDTPVVARGAGTGLSGGALPLADGVVLSLARFNRTLDIDPVNRTARVQPGVRNLAISEAAAAHGLYYAPDPSSQIACTIGGNVAENSGGVHCLKYGLTVHNVLGVRAADPDDWRRVAIGGKTLDAPGYDLLALLIGSEGMLGVVTEVTVRLLPAPPDRRGGAGGVSGTGAGGGSRGRRDRRRHHPRGARDDGRAGDPRRRRLRARRLPRRRRGHPVLRARRDRRRSRPTLARVSAPASQPMAPSTCGSPATADEQACVLAGT